MKPTLLALLAGAAIAVAADKPIVYNHIPDANEAVDPRAREIDPLVNAALAPNYKIVDLPHSPDYLGPKATAGSLPRVAKTPAGEALGGQVLVGYVITTEGHAGSPVILQTSDARLNAIAIKAMEGWRFQPATLKGTAIPTTAAQDFIFETTPTEFVPQVLEPTGGKISRPKDWFYVEAQRGSSYVWTLSREDTSGGDKSYQTGVRIQWITKIKDGTGKSARQFILDFVADKKKEADKVLETCEAKDQGLFTRMCLETEEGPYHILYSLFWGSKDLDMAVVSVAGTPKELWETYAPAFHKMGVFEIIDMKRFEK